MRSAVVCFMETKRFAGKVKTPEEICLTLLHKTFAVFTYFGNIRAIAKEEMCRQLSAGGALQWCNRI